MREIKILFIVSAIVGILYWGVEPLAHSIMSPKVTPANFTFSDLKEVDLKSGNVLAGKEIALSCVGCHSINSAGLSAPMSAADAGAAFGVNPPDLSDAGLIYDPRFLVAFVQDPTKATLTKHSAMPAAVGSEKDAIDLVSYLISIAPKEQTNKEVFISACARCHSAKYGDVDVQTPMVDLKRSLFGVTNDAMPIETPDLSMMIRSRGTHYLNIFINDPQKYLPGTAMPRVGLTQKAQNQVIAYMEEIGDSKKKERDSLGWKIILYVAIMAVVAYGWKRFIWRDLH